MPNPKTKGGERHHRHHRHQPLSFNGLMLTKPHCLRHQGQEVSAVTNRVTQITRHASSRNHRIHRGFWCPRARGDNGDAKIPALSETYP
jgi:hypothetical protein